MAKSTKMFATLEVYSKQEDTMLSSFVTEDAFRDFLIERLQKFQEDYEDCKEIDYSKTTSNIETFIKYFYKKQVELALEWGITEVHMLDFETQTITKYN